MNPKTTNVLLVLLLVVGAYFVFVERDAPTTYERDQIASEQRTEDGTAVFTSEQLSTESVASVTIQRGDDAVVVLTKEGQDWYQTQPVRFPLNTWSARQVIDDAAGLRYTRRFEPANSESDELPMREQVSLSPPLASVTLEVEDKTRSTQKIHLGRKAIGGRAYAVFNNDQRVYVVNDALHRQILDGQVADWRKRSIDAPTEGQAQRVILTRQGKAVAVRKADGNWSLDNPHSGRVDTEAVKGLLAAVGNLHIDRFVADSPEDPALYGLDEPRTQLSVYMPAAASADTQPATTQPHDEPADQAASGSEVYMLRMGAPVDLKSEHYFATWVADGQRGAVFTLLASDVEKFAKSVDDLRDARITPIKAADVRQLTLKRSEAQVVSLSRGTDGWSFVAPGPGFEADSGSVSSLVDSITQAQAQAYLQQTDSFAAPSATVTLEAIGRSEPDVLRIYPKQKDTYPVLRNQETTIYLVPDSSLENLFAPIAALRQKTVLDVTADAVTRMTIEHADGRRYVFRRSQSDAGLAKPASQPALERVIPATQPKGLVGSWRLTDHDKFESEAFDRLLAMFLPLRAESWIAEGSSVPEASEPSETLSVQLELAEGLRHTVQVDLGRRCGMRVDQSAEGQWFQLSDALIELLGGEFRLRTVLPLSINEMTSVQVIRQDGSVTIKRDQDGKYVDQDGHDVDQSVVGVLFDTLAGLRVDQFIQPEHVSQPPLKIVVKTNSGQTYRLAFATPKETRYVATNGQQWFTVDADTYRKLNAPLIGQQEPTS